MSEQHIERHRIHTVITRSAILHVEDALEIGKLRLFALAYKRGQGAQAHAIHFLDVADARPLMRDLATGRLREKYTEFKGSRNGGQPVSRILTVKDRGQEARSPMIIELANGPGEVIGQGAIKPKGKPTTSVAIFLSRWETRKLSLAVLEYLQACAVAEALAKAKVGGVIQAEAALQAEELPAEGKNEQPFVEPTAPPIQADATATAFWAAVYAVGMAQAEGAEIVKQTGGDWSEALAMLPGNGRGGAR